MKFTKMHGLGNDFIIIYQPERELSYKNICNRQTGIGADGVVLLTPSQHADICMQIINADGSKAEQCGNALRCVAKYLYEQLNIKKEKLLLETAVGLQEAVLTIEDNVVTTVTVDMKKPIFSPTNIPVKLMGQNIIGQSIEIEEKSLIYTAVSLGNPHIIIEVDDLSTAPLTTWGPLLEKHPLFPNSINVEFVNFISTTEVSARVWERGVGETSACGSGACAIVVAGVLLGKLERRATVQLKGGSLEIFWDPRQDNVYMSGPATFVFQGEIM